jgi:hypothetical protein
MPTAGYGGGGGGGSMDGSGGHNGGGGQGGKIRLAYGAAGILPMNSLLVHIPPREESSAYSPICPVGNGADVPNGSVEYTVPPVSALPARFDGTYSAWLVASTYSSPSSARTVIVTLRQYAYAGGPSTTVALTRTLTPANDAVNGYTDMGAVTLPLWDLPPGNTDAYFTATIASGLTADRFFDLILLSTTGQVVFVNMTGTAFAQNMWIDVPELGRDLGRVLASDADRDRARSVVGSDPSNRISGGPLCVTPNAHNRLLIYQGLGMPSATLSYLPNWWADRLS